MIKYYGQTKYNVITKDENKTLIFANSIYGGNNYVKKDVLDIVENEKRELSNTYAEEIVDEHIIYLEKISQKSE